MRNSGEIRLLKVPAGQRHFSAYAKNEFPSTNASVDAGKKTRSPWSKAFVSTNPENCQCLIARHSGRIWSIVGTDFTQQDFKDPSYWPHLR